MAKSTVSNCGGVKLINVKPPKKDKSKQKKGGK